MINVEAFFKISYGLYIVSAGDKIKGNAYVSNTVFQVTAEPPRFAICSNKNNYTTEFIKDKQSFAVSVLDVDASSELIGQLGYKSGRDIDKMNGLQLKYAELGVPIVLNECMAYFECNVVETFDVGTHIMFIGELVNSELMDATKEPLTYAHYRNVRKGFSPKNAPTYIDKSKLTTKVEQVQTVQKKCSVCGYMYDDSKENIKFDDLPDSWHCPICGADKEDFTNV